MVISQHFLYITLFLLTYLIVLIEKFERKFYPGTTLTPSPYTILLFLMKQQEIGQTDLGEVLGYRAIASELVDGRKEISQEQAKVLGRFFHVKPSLFIA